MLVFKRNWIWVPGLALILKVCYQRLWPLSWEGRARGSDARLGDRHKRTVMEQRERQGPQGGSVRESSGRSHVVGPVSRGHVPGLHSHCQGRRHGLSRSQMGQWHGLMCVPRWAWCGRNGSQDHQEAHAVVQARQNDGRGVGSGQKRQKEVKRFRVYLTGRKGA